MKKFMLHGVSRDPSRFCVTPGILREIIERPGCELMFDDGYRSVHDLLIHMNPATLKRTSVFVVTGRVGAFNDWDRHGELSGKPLMTWEQIYGLKGLGVRFGSHSHNHADLRKLDDEGLDREVRGSKRILEERLGEKVEGFAYPFGYFDERVIAAVRDAGYEWAVTASGSIWEGRGNPYRKRRIDISGLDPGWLLRAKLNGLYDVMAVVGLPALLWEKALLSIRPI